MLTVVRATSMCHIQMLSEVIFVLLGKNIKSYLWSIFLNEGQLWWTVPFMKPSSLCNPISL